MIEANNHNHFFLFVNTKSGGGLGQDYLTVVNKRLKFRNKNEEYAFVYLYDMCSV